MTYPSDKIRNTFGSFQCSNPIAATYYMTIKLITFIFIFVARHYAVQSTIQRKNGYFVTVVSAEIYKQKYILAI